MPSKPRTATAVADPETTGAPAPVESPTPPPAEPIFDPATDDEDEEDEEEEEEDDRAPATPSSGDGGLDVAGLIDQFSVLMAQREEQIWARLEERLARISPPAINGHAPSLDVVPTVPVGAPPDWPGMPAPFEPTLEPAPAPARPRQRRMVAFIPQIDPYNPKQTTFKTWINGREIRAKRGQVMILEMGHGVNLAKNGHGNCVDIAAMQGSLSAAATLEIPERPNYALPNDWDGTPLTNRSSVPVGR